METGPSTVVHEIFSYLISQTERSATSEHLFSEYEEIKAHAGDSFDARYIKLYLEWEEFIVSHETLSNKHTSADDIRRHVKESYPIDTLDTKMRLLFLDETHQALYIYEIFSQYIATYLTRKHGTQQLETLLHDPSNHDAIQKINVTPAGLDFGEFNASIDTDNLSIIDITKIFKDVYTLLFTIVDRLYDEKTASGFFNKIYKTLQQIYDREIASIFLHILPEQVLGLDDWLSALSKEELEKQVEEKTRELEALNNSLEEKVDERTRELQDAYKELQKLDDKKSEFISIAAHQLRTPLSGFKWTFNMLLNGEYGNLSDEQKDILSKTNTNNDRIIKIVNDLLNTDTIASGDVTPKFADVNISELISEAIFESSELAKEKRITITRNEDTTIVASVDKEKMSAVIQNLVDNAVKYTPADGTITITTTLEGDTCTITVTDTGIGIPQNEQSSIFERFYRAQNAIRTHANGSGLGLFIAKSIVESHNGTLSFFSEEGKGTTFTVTLPHSCKVS